MTSPRDATPDVEHLLDNAAVAAQAEELLRNPDGTETILRQAVRMNVAEPLLARSASGESIRQLLTDIKNHPCWIDDMDHTMFDPRVGDILDRIDEALAAPSTRNEK